MSRVICLAQSMRSIVRTLTECWEYHGVKPTNVVWSWTAVDDPARPTRVAMTFWRHEFDDRLLRVYRNRPLKKGGERRFGFKERIKHLKLAQDELGGEVRVVLITPKDTEASPRRIQEREPVDWRMRVVMLNTTNGDFRLERIEDSPNAPRP